MTILLQKLLINLSKNSGNTSEDPTDANKHDINDKSPKFFVKNV